jgi:glutamate dehydrogenase
MTADSDAIAVELLAKLVERARERLPSPEGEAAVAFVRRYYARAPWDDLVQRSGTDLYGAAVAFYRLLEAHRAAEPLVRVFNPRIDEDGWECPHTVVRVVTDDMPFLVDSIKMAVNRARLTVHLSIYPVIPIERDEQGRFQRLAERDGQATALIHLEVDRRTESDVLAALRTDIVNTLGDVRAAVSGWQTMRARMRAVIGELDAPPRGVDPEQAAEVRAFLAWVEDHHFIFTGYREYELVEEAGELELRVMADSELGVSGRRRSGDYSRTFSALPPDVRAGFREPTLLVLTKANERSRVHRPDYLDYIGVKRFDEEGAVRGERRFLGLFTASFFNQNPTDIPLLRQKIRAAVESVRLPPGDHDRKALRNVLETYPRDELLQISPAELGQNAMRILQLRERQRPGLFVRSEAFGRFVSCLVFIPRERFDTGVRRKIQAMLMSVFGGRSVDFRVQLTESPLVQVLYTVHTPPGPPVPYDSKALESKIEAMIRSWIDDLAGALRDQYGEEEGSRLFGRYARAFPVGYREDFDPRTAARDVSRIEALGKRTAPIFVLHQYPEDDPHLLRLKLFVPGQPVMLSDIIPILENTGLRVVGERPYLVRAEEQVTHVHDFALLRSEHELGIDAVKEPFQQVLAAVWAGQAENDGFNQLVLRARLGWREIAVVRAYAKYLKQVGVAFSQSYMEEVLTAHADIVRLIVGAFLARFDPAKRERAAIRIARISAHVHEALDRVEGLDADRILRAFLALVHATLRTNFFQRERDGKPKDRIAFKLDPALLGHLPEPRPAYEIWAYSPQMEGVHMRAGKVARGGIRWSDRREDFRTEIFDLVKAQIVKNSIIVPVGAKGGFVVKQASGGGRAGRLEEAMRCYQTFVRGLLDLTDNLVGGHTVPPPDVVRYDGDDPYLVVAADKGTATFSDIANGIAEQYGFWLGDAFASGGSAGYDHKKMGITARGAWESVKRHFRDTGRDIETEDFTVVGIGDMSGDVFGNGMLLSRHIKLIGAFDHRHVFLDPNPDPVASFEERERLANLGQSSWADYDRGLVSVGGGVWPRTVKSIPLDDHARQVLGVDAHSLTPQELIRALLRAPVDLLWNGGIGTYVKARSEGDADVGDRGNDGCRVNGAELRCQVVCEGGNLGFSQRGRVEYALAGGRINSDFIDNAGGVNCSDHEVNIKILLDELVRSGDLTRKQRNQQLAALTDEVAALVIEENYWQNWALSLLQRQASTQQDLMGRLVRYLEKDSGLDRAREGLPDETELEARHLAGGGLTRPELAVLVSHAKNVVYQELLDSVAVEDPFLIRELLRYFPQPLRGPYREAIQRHRLRRELIATFVTNRLVNRLGPAYVFDLRAARGISVTDSTRAYLTVWEMFSLRELWREVASLDGEVSAGVLADMLLHGISLIRRAALWLLRNRPLPVDIEAGAREFAPCGELLIGSLAEFLTPRQSERLQARTEPFVTAGVPAGLARHVASLDTLYATLDIATIGGRSAMAEQWIAQVYFAAEEYFHLDWLQERVAALAPGDPWEERARTAMLAQVDDLRLALTEEILSSGAQSGDPEAVIDVWLGGRHGPAERFARWMEEARAVDEVRVPLLSVLLTELRMLVGQGPAQRDRYIQS